MRYYSAFVASVPVSWSNIMLRSAKWHPLTRFYATKKVTSKDAKPKVDLRQLAAQRDREKRRLQIKRGNARTLQKLREEALKFQRLPHTFDIVEAMRYIRAAETGRSAHATTLTLNMRIVAERGVPKVSGAVRLPRPLDEERILVLTTDSELAEQARQAGATMVGSDNIINAIKEGGPLEFDRVYATPDIMSRVNQIARILGPRGLMPSPKRGTVTTEIYKVITGARGEMTFKQIDDFLMIPVGRASFSDTEIVRNILSVTDRVRSILASAASAKKGQIGRTLLTSTFSPSISIVV